LFVCLFQGNTYSIPGTTAASDPNKQRAIHSTMPPCNHEPSQATNQTTQASNHLPEPCVRPVNP
jgi:hypothetical protein